MGLQTLANLRAELEGTIGRNPDALNVVLNRWVNFGYLDLASKVDFYVLDNRFVITTAAGQFEYPHTALQADPLRHLATKLVWDETGKRRLDWLPLPDFYSYDLQNPGVPQYWTIDGDLLLVSPPEGASRNLRVVYKEAPAPLVNDTDVTVLPSVWDLAVVQLAASHGFAALNEEQRSAYWLQEAIQYIQTRISESRAEVEMPGLEPSYPRFTAAEAGA